MKVPAGGGTPEPLTTLDKDRFDIAHRFPQFLPDDRHFLFYVVSISSPVTSEYSGIYAGSLDSDETLMLLKSESRALYSGGHLLYRAGSTLMAHAFDASTLTLSGDPSPVTSDVPGGAFSWGGAQFGASEADVLVHLRGIQASLSVLTFRDRDGNILDTMGEPGVYLDPALSRDGGAPDLLRLSAARRRQLERLDAGHANFPGDTVIDGEVRTTVRVQVGPPCSSPSIGPDTAN